MIGRTLYFQGRSLEIRKITPKEAKEYLGDRNLRNRNIRSGVVAMLAADMDAGAWMFNGNAICFAEDGGLLDGQHRFTACVEANKPFWTVVVRRLPPEAMGTLDQNAPRSGGDYLKLSGMSHATKRAAALRALNIITEGKLRNRGIRKLSNRELLELNTGVNLDRHLSWAATGGAGLTALGLACGWMVALRYLCFARDESAAEWFFDRMIYGDELEREHPLWVLRAKLTEAKQRRSISRAGHPAPVLSEFVMMAWNAMRTAKRIRVFKLSEQPTVLSD